MNKILGTLEWMSKYGIFDILTILGVFTFLGNMVRKGFPSNYEHLHISVSQGGPVFIPPNINLPQSFSIQLSNAGQTNVYVARAFFKTRQRVWWTLWLWDRTTQLRVHPRSDRIADKDNAFELKFTGERPNLFTEYETLIPAGHNHRRTTWLALEEPVDQRLIDVRKCGVLYVEYATSNKQGVHKVRL
jgi:hypothetical protein